MGEFKESGLRIFEFSRVGFVVGLVFEGCELVVGGRPTSNRGWPPTILAINRLLPMFALVLP